MKINLASLIGIAVCLAACVSNAPTGQPATEASVDDATHESAYCAVGDILLDTHFEGANMGRCATTADGSFELTIYPEDEPPINVSPWYAFRVSGTPGDTVTIKLNFQDGFARYWPKQSTDRVTWTPLSDRLVNMGSDQQNMTLSLRLEEAQTWIAAQEILADSWFTAWMAELQDTSALESRLLGRSELGRPIIGFESADRREIILLLGRQHPPEVTGTLTLRPFIDTLLENSPLANQFRERFKLVIVPFINPDGVAEGHWRHGMNGVDLNRDWGPFTQPETQSIRRRLDVLESQGQVVRLMLDFHSTQNNLFYTQLADETTDPPGFATRWLQAAAARLPDYSFKHDAVQVSDQPNSKNYFYKTYGIPAITYETGDETARPSIDASARVFAEEMMRLMLSYPPDPDRTGG